MNDRAKDISALMESVEEVFSEVDQTDEHEAPESHSLLEVWQAVLSNGKTLRHDPSSMQEVMAVTHRYPQIKVQEVSRYRMLYFDVLQEFADLLDAEIASDPECFKHAEPEADGTENRHHYLNLLAQWNALGAQLESEWNSNDDDAHLTFAAILEARNFLLGQQGLVAHLESIDFALSEDESAELVAATFAGQEG